MVLRKLPGILLQQTIHHGKTVHVCARRATASSPSESSVFIERMLEVPVIVLSEHDDVDIIGPPDPVSNLRPVLRKKWFQETKLQKELREMQDATQSWNQQFWATHNRNFIQNRQEFVNRRQSSGQECQLSAEEMSEFYTSFLDKNWEIHVRYNFEWYKKNFTLLFLTLCVNLEKIFKIH